MIASGTHVIVRWTDGALSLTGWGVFLFVVVLMFLALALMQRR